MATFFTGVFFKYFLVPLLAVFFNIHVKHASKNDKFAKLTKEDFAVGLELALSSLIALLVYTVHNYRWHSTSDIEMVDRMMILPWTLTGFLVSLWGLSTLTRKYGWVKKTKMKWWCGIIIPFCYGLATLFFLVKWVGG